MNFLFDSQINYFTDCEGKTDLPFSIFGLTQQGMQHRHWSIGNQDAASIFVGKSSIIGAVADGCTSGRNLNGKSNNQVGAYVSSYLSVRILRKLVIKRKIPLDELMSTFQTEFQANLTRLLRTINPWKAERKEIISNFLLSTVVFFLLTNKGFLVAHCGDGIVVINGTPKDLGQTDGSYFVQNIGRDSELSGPREWNPMFIDLASGDLGDLSTLFMATDGFDDQDILDHQLFSDFFINEINRDFQRGLVNKRTEFRKGFVDPILEMKNGRTWPEDDATFISVKRVN